MADSKYLQMLAQKFPNHRSVKAEIINLRAILALPKGTEYFLCDLHGEYDAFQYFVRSASGTIKYKIDEAFRNVLSAEDREQLAALIYDPVNELKRREKAQKDFDDWCRQAIYRLILVCRLVSSKYTRSKVRKILPDHSGYVMDELLFADDDENRSSYYEEIINAVIEYDAARTLIKELADTISLMAVDQLHIIGDIFDRGPKPDMIMDFLMSRREVDIPWGNHDVVWMGAACGTRACIANILRMNISYNNFDMLEYGYGINLRPLAVIADRVYAGDDCKAFWPHVIDKNRLDPIPEDLAAKMHKMMAIIQFKCEGQIIKAHPEYHMDHRLLLDKIDFEKGTVECYGQTYDLKDKNLPTIDPADPYKLSPEEEKVMTALEASIRVSEKLHEHIRFLYSHGALFKTCNGNLMFHGCIPFTEDGEFLDVTINGKTNHGAQLMRFLDAEIRDAYFHPPEGQTSAEAANIMWYLWLAPDSPLFGKDKMTTFERLFIADKKTHKEHTVPYYRLINDKHICIKIIRDFGLDPARGKILNGHVPVKIKDGESPIKGGGMLYVIDGGISKAYQKTTGIAGYTFIFNSRFMALSEHKPYQPIKPDGTQEFNSPVIMKVYDLPSRMQIIDTDTGRKLQEQIDDLEQLFEEYKKGTIKEVYPKKGKYYSKN
ncbi:MAG: fructose-1,6-bisphosphatase [Mogibacterium sp.]|nr:fructose-1,6-bisphosphatase [Mogibacterium sp.]